MRKLKIGLLITPGMSQFNLKVLDQVQSLVITSVCFAIINVKKPLTFKQKLKKNLKRGRGGYMLIMALNKMKRRNSKQINTKDYLDRHQIEYIETDNPYNETMLSVIKEQKLDLLLLINGYGIIKKPLLNICPHGVLSYHHGDLRKYRGMPPVFWEMYYGEKEVGAVVQVLDEGLDKGEVMAECKVPIPKKARLADVKKQLYDKSIQLMPEAIHNIYYGVQPVEINEFGKVYTLPNIRQWLWFQVKMLFRKVRK